MFSLGGVYIGNCFFKMHNVLNLILWNTVMGTINKISYHKNKNKKKKEKKEKKREKCLFIGVLYL